MPLQRVTPDGFESRVALRGRPSTEDVMDLCHLYPKAPLPVLAAIHRYVDKGYRPGGFTTAVLENNLVNAMALADKDSKAGLEDIISFCKYEIPSRCWGSEKRVEFWVDHCDSWHKERP